MHEWNLFMLSKLGLDMQGLHKHTFRITVGALPAENIWPDHFFCPDNSHGIMKCQSSACILSPSSPSCWKTAHVHQLLLHSSLRFINNPSLFSEWCGICVESMQELIKHRLEWKLSLNGLEIITVDLPAPCMRGSASLHFQIQHMKLFNVVPHSCTSSLCHHSLMLSILCVRYRHAGKQLHQLTSSLAPCLCFLNQTAVL